MRTTFFIILFLSTTCVWSLEGPTEKPYAQSSTAITDNIFKDGIIYRISIPATNVYALSGRWLSEQAGISLESLNEGNFQIYGMPGGPLRHDSNYDDTERLLALPMRIDGLEDGRFDLEDAVYFYSEGADIVQYDETINEYVQVKNPFSELNFVYLKVGGTLMSNLVSHEELNIIPDATTSSYWFNTFFHEDKVNLLDAFESTQGSGQTWFGEELSNTSTYDLQRQIILPEGRLTNAKVRISLAGRSSSKESVEIEISGQTASVDYSPVNTADIEALYARQVEVRLSDLSIHPSDNMYIRFDKNSSDAKLWIDYATVQGWKQTNFQNASLQFNNLAVYNHSEINGINIISSDEIQVWDISEPNITLQKALYSTASGTSILDSGTKIHSYIAFNDQTVAIPSSIDQINNNSLIEMSNVDLVIISTAATLSASQRLAAHRQDEQGITSLIVDPQTIYDLYSSGRQDPTAIRNYVRDLYKKYSRFNFLLLMGDASFDYRYINKIHPKSNLVPTFETFNSLDPLLAFPSDDYFALLDDGENGNLRGDLDISVGRLTVNNSIEAETVVDKVINYDENLTKFGPFKTHVAFLADDEDNNLHINDAERIADELTENHPIFNQDKIYFDAFQQESTPGGNRYPSATSRLNNIAERGALIINYLGHGGPNGWGQERVLKVDDINSWTNLDRLPLIITATCSFTGFDHPGIVSAGEAALLNPTGGALALFTTVRSVFASKNFQLTRSVFREVFQQENGDYLPIGEIMRRSKNRNPNDNTNARKFFLIGDPTITLALPKLSVNTDRINEINVSDIDPSDQLSALDQVQLEASVLTLDGIVIDNFNGIAEIIVYDKPSDVQTIANDARSFVKTFDVQQNIIYKGKTEVVNGKISTDFTIPIDIDYQVGAAKITYYAISEDKVEAVGFNNDIWIGGTSKSPIQDDRPPTVQSYINDRSFISGDEVPLSNVGIVDISDDFGINLSTTGIGHEITAIFDGDTGSTIFLNEFLESSSVNSKAGTIVFAIPDLDVGLHKMTIKVFDVANNVTEETVDFIISENIASSISDVQIRPNPILQTATIDVVHNVAGRNVVMDMLVVDISGRQMESISKRLLSEGGVSTFEWTPAVDYPGSYICYITVKSTTSTESEASIAKKVILLK